MLKLHGMSRSNYYNLTRACFEEKGVAYEAVKAVPSQEEDYLQKSPMGKVPCIETEQGFISESFAIADYLDHIHPENPLLPTGPFERAKAIEYIRHLELDIELTARRCLPAAFFGADLSEETKASTRKDLRRGMASLSRLIQCDPYVLGHDFSLADLYTYYSFGLASAIVDKIYSEDLLADLPQIKTLIGELAKRDSIQTIEAG